MLGVSMSNGNSKYSDEYRYENNKFVWYKFVSYQFFLHKMIYTLPAQSFFEDFFP